MNEFSDYSGPQGAVIATGSKVVPIWTVEGYLALLASVAVVTGVRS